MTANEFKTYIVIREINGLGYNLFLCCGESRNYSAIAHRVYHSIILLRQDNTYCTELWLIIFPGVISNGVYGKEGIAIVESKRTRYFLFDFQFPYPSFVGFVIRGIIGLSRKLKI